MGNDFLWKEFYLDKIDPTWNTFFQQETQKDYFFPLLAKLNEEYQNYKCWPEKENIFRLLQEISLDKIKVVILGQDPYHSPGTADGIAFSTQRLNYIPPSLENIFFEFSKDCNCALPTKGDLLPWVKEGVFLLNTALTVRERQALSHIKLWEEFVYSLLTHLNNYNKKIIWVFWGQKAKKIGENCGISGENYILTSTHPSPYSARGKEQNQEGYFIGSRVFFKINKLLAKLGKEQINWLSILNPNSE